MDFLIDNIFVEFGGLVFQQTIGIPMGTNCAPLLADFFVFLWNRIYPTACTERRKEKLAQSFNFTFRYIDDVLSLNNNKFSDHLHLIYPSELEIKDTPDTDKSV